MMRSWLRSCEVNCCKTGAVALRCSFGIGALQDCKRNRRRRSL
jgi:hypothetical protein